MSELLSSKTDETGKKSGDLPNLNQSLDQIISETIKEKKKPQFKQQNNKNVNYNNRERPRGRGRGRGRGRFRGRGNYRRGRGSSSYHPMAYKQTWHNPVSGFSTTSYSPSYQAKLNRKIVTQGYRDSLQYTQTEYRPPNNITLFNENNCIPIFQMLCTKFNLEPTICTLTVQKDKQGNDKIQLQIDLDVSSTESLPAQCFILRQVAWGTSKEHATKTAVLQLLKHPSILQLFKNLTATLNKNNTNSNNSTISSGSTGIPEAVPANLNNNKQVNNTTHVLNNTQNHPKAIHATVNMDKPTEWEDIQN